MTIGNTRIWSESEEFHLFLSTNRSNAIRNAGEGCLKTKKVFLFSVFNVVHNAFHFVFVSFETK